MGRIALLPERALAMADQIPEHLCPGAAKGLTEAGTFEHLRLWMVFARIETECYFKTLNGRNQRLNVALGRLQCIHCLHAQPRSGPF